jgi:hypothetical protein
MTLLVWTTGDVISVALAAIFLILLFALWVPVWIKQARCKHDGSIGETQACDAVCHKCGKNLGFIGSWELEQKSE